MVDVIVIGAGLAGLIAAGELESRGRTVCVLEARDRIGGRVWLQRDALRGLDLDMGGAWVADVQPAVWAEADRYGVRREHDALPSSVRWRFGGERVERALPVDVADLGALGRAVSAARAARRHDADRPPDAQGLEDLDVPATDWVAALDLPIRVRELVLFWISACASAYPASASMLDFLRWISAADHRIWAHLEAAVLGWRFPDGDGGALEAIAADVQGKIAAWAPRWPPSSRPATRRSSPPRPASATPPPHRRHRADRRARIDRVHAAARGREAARRCREPRRSGRQGLGDRPQRPDDLCAMGYGTRFDFVGAMDAPPRRTVSCSCALRPVRGRSGRDDAAAVAAACASWRRRPRSSRSTPTTGPATRTPRRTWCHASGQIHAAWSALRAPDRGLHFAGAHTALRWPASWTARSRAATVSPPRSRRRSEGVCGAQFARVASGRVNGGP